MSDTKTLHGSEMLYGRLRGSSAFMFENMIENQGFWSQTGPYSDVVLSTRVRIARNMPGFLFPNKMDRRSVELIHSIGKRFVEDSELSSDLSFIDLHVLDDNDKRFLRERNLITYEMEKSKDSAIVLEGDEQFSILINEEDHFRIQVIKPGFQIMDAYRLADRVDDDLNRFASYAYSDDLGYLTACPSNVGTGLRVSSMVHLPMLTLLNRIPETGKLIRDMGFVLRGTSGDDYKTVGCMYLISNRISLGISEIDIIEELDVVTSKVVELESELRDSYVSEQGNHLDDRVWRSYGILQYSRKMHFLEAMEHLSHVRLGIILSVVKNISLFKINDLMVNIQQSHLQKIANKVFDDTTECDIFRAEYLRKQLK